jgi:hypothetical protein
MDAEINTISRDSHEILFSLEGKKKEQWILLTSDRHHDNAHTDWSMEKRHLQEAKSRGAAICDFGDLFCAMQGKWDKRADVSQCRPEHQQGRYLDALVETAQKFYAPYAKNFLFMSPGNHETSITKRHETDLTERLAEGLGRSEIGYPVVGAYSGYIRFRSIRPNTKSSRGSLTLFYHHGYGGGGPVTRGVIQTNRMAVYLPDANLVVSGHTHDSWVVPVGRSRITPMGKTYIDRQVHVKIPGYKDEYTGGDGWHHHRGGPPKVQGAFWLRIFRATSSARGQEADSLDYEILEAR